MNNVILTIVTFSPLAGVLLLLLLKEDQKKAIKLVALVTSILSFLFSLHLYFYFDDNLSKIQFEVNVP